MKGPVINKSKKLMPAAIIAKPATTAKADLEIMAKEIALITTKCCRNDIEVFDIIVTFSGIKDIKKRIKSLTQHMEIKYILIYSAKQISETEQEFLEFVEEMESWYGIHIKRMVV